MSSSLSSATVAVEKATSDLLLDPDWTMNIEICDSVNSNHWQAKDVMKALKKRLQHKDGKVQLLALTLLETMVKNCGEYVHFQIAEKNILGEMVRIVKKKADMHVRDKILILLDSWQEAFGGPGGKYPQYYWAYEELRRSGVEFPRRSVDAAPIFTPPPTHPITRHPHVGFGMPSGSSRRLDETMATEVEGLSLSSLDSMRDVMDLLNDMLQAVDPSDRVAVKDEVIVDLADRCRSNQKKLMQMITSTGDEELLARGLELNDSLQTLLAKHDAIASGSALPVQAAKPTETCLQSGEVKDFERPGSGSPAPVASAAKSQIDEDDDEEDEFAQLARRHSKLTPVPSSTTSAGKSEGPAPTDDNTEPSLKTSTSDAASCNALVLADPPPPVRTTKEQDIIELLSITLSTPSTTPQTPQPSSTVPTGPHTYPQAPQSYSGNQTPLSYLGNQGQVSFSSYVVPWARPQQHQHSQTDLRPQFQSNPETQGQSPRPQQAPSQPHPQSQHQLQPQPQPQPQVQARPESRSYEQFQTQPQMRPEYAQYSYGYPPPPWVTSPDNTSDNQANTASNMFWTPRAHMNSYYAPLYAGRALQQSTSFPARTSNGTTVIGDTQPTASVSNPVNAAGQKPFIPSYRLFEDLNVFGSDGKHNATNNTSPSLSGPPAQGMIGGRKWNV